jgi:hypothetical protein
MPNAQGTVVPTTRGVDTNTGPGTDRGKTHRPWSPTRNTAERDFSVKRAAKGHFAGLLQDIGPCRTVRAVRSIVVEEMMAMQTLILLSVGLVAACLCAVWSTLRETPHGVARAANRSDPPPLDRSRPDTLEGVVVDQLIDGLITPRQYRRAMEHLAASDDKRHPLAAPPEFGSADA